MAAMAVECSIEARAYFDHVGAYAEFVGHHLSGGRFMTLAGRRRSKHDDHRPVEIKLDGGYFGVPGEGQVGIDDPRLTEIIGAGVERGTDTDTDPTTFGARRGLLLLPFVPADQFLGLSSSSG